jgi:hypothetical protein
MRSQTSKHRGATPEWVDSVLDALHKQNARLERIEFLLEHQHGRGPRDAADRALLAAIAEASEGLPFRASDLRKRAEFAPKLAEALLGADIVSDRQLGKLLSRMHQGLAVDGVRLERLGRWWRAVCVV